MSADTAAVIGAVAGLLTAAMNVYTYVTTQKQIDTLIQTVGDQSKQVSDSNRRMAGVLKSSQATVDKIIDRVLPLPDGG